MSDKVYKTSRKIREQNLESQKRCRKRLRDGERLIEIPVSAADFADAAAFYAYIKELQTSEKELRTCLDESYAREDELRTLLSEAHARCDRLFDELDKRPFLLPPSPTDSPSITSGDASSDHGYDAKRSVARIFELAERASRRFD